MKVNFMVMCEYATQQANGSPILCGIFRGITTETLPARLAPFWLALEIEAEPHEAGEHHFSLRFVDEDGNIFFEDHLIGQFKRRPDLSPSYLYMAETIEVRKEIEKRGTYRFDMVWNDQVLGQLRLEVS
ncbi:MAG: hypothetical protein WCK51_10370 [Armatimonadota bacterium]